MVSISVGSQGIVMLRYSVPALRLGYRNIVCFDEVLSVCLGVNER